MRGKAQAGTSPPTNNMVDHNDFRYAPARAVTTADHLIECKRKYSHDVWHVIAEVIKAWEATNPQQYASFLIEHEDIKQTRKSMNVGLSTFTGVSKDKATGGILRFTLDIPEKVVYMLRALYSPDELPFDKKFYAEFGKRFPKFRIMERKR